MQAAESTAAHGLVPRSWIHALRLPGQCAVCRGWGHERVCATCIDRFASPRPRCSRCALQTPKPVDGCGSCLREALSFDAAVVAFDYGPPWDRLVTRFKFHAGLDLAPVFASRLAAAMQRSALAEMPALWLPVPLADERLRERGFNQAWEIARRAAPLLGAPADNGLLLRLRDTPHQLSTPPAERAGNVRNAFAVEPARRHELRGRHVGLVDDVLTSGATAGEIAAVLKQSGASRVTVAALARTPRH